MGLLFFPRGGSAQVARYLVPQLAAAGWPTSLVVGSLGGPEEDTNAQRFFAGIDVHALDYSGAMAAHEDGQDALAAPVPMHPSYEDRRGAPDRVLADVDPALLDHLAGVWEAPFAAAGGDGAALFHLHHLTPQLEAVRRRWPATPLVAHLHGTELKMLEAAALEQGRTWRHGRFWTDRLRSWAQRSDHLVTVSPGDAETAAGLLGVGPEHITAVENGVDVERFRPRPMATDEAVSLLRRWLVDDPKGWDVSGVPGSVRYGKADLDRFVDPVSGRLAPILLWVGRFTGAKRVPLLLRAYARARARFHQAAPLVLWGGHPGEWEGEHPADVIAEVGPDGIFLSGWRGHDDLPLALSLAGTLVMPSVNDSYPQTPLEAMASGVPVLATTSGGFPGMVNTEPGRPTGWLVPPDDIDALTDAIVAVVNGPEERDRRAARALDHARTTFSWTGLVPRFEAVYETASQCARRRPVGP